MDDATFSSVVSARLDPVLAPRGFPYAGNHNGVAAPGELARLNPDSVLFHCDGIDAVAAVKARYPGWSTRLHESYGTQEIICLDLWVQMEHGAPSWSFESFESDVVEVAGARAQERLSALQQGPIEQWADQLANMLDAYFRDLESAGSTAGR